MRRRCRGYSAREHALHTVALVMDIHSFDRYRFNFMINFALGDSKFKFNLRARSLLCMRVGIQYGPGREGLEFMFV